MLFVLSYNPEITDDLFIQIVDSDTFSILRLRSGCQRGLCLRIMATFPFLPTTTSTFAKSCLLRRSGYEGRVGGQTSTLDCFSMEYWDNGIS